MSNTDQSTTRFQDGWNLADETIRNHGLEASMDLLDQYHGVIHLRDTEASNPIPPSNTRTFRPVYAQQARRMSWRPLIIAAIGFILCTSACAFLIGWFIAAALRIPA